MSSYRQFMGFRSRLSIQSYSSVSFNRQTIAEITRLDIKDLLSVDIGKQVRAQGWVTSIRKHKNVTFFQIHDGISDKEIQLVSTPDKSENINIGCSVSAIGTIGLRQGRASEKEIIVSQISVLGACDPETYPIQKENHDQYELRQIPHLRIRNKKFRDIMRLKSSLSLSFRQEFRRRDYTEIFTPCITFTDAEGAGESFCLKDSDSHFGLNAYLSVSAQLYLEAASLSLGRVFSLGPAFRAEKHNSSRHLSEFLMLEAEIAFIDDIHALMNECESLIRNALKDCHGITDQMRENYFADSFPRVTYREALEILAKNSEKFSSIPTFGESLKAEHEKYLAGTVFESPVFVYDYPQDCKAFYMKLNPDQKTVACFDLLAPAVGELVGGSLRETCVQKIENAMKKFSINKENYDWYLDLNRFGTASRGGFGLGFERLAQLLTSELNIRETAFIPRDGYARNHKRMIDTDQILSHCSSEEGISDKKLRSIFPETNPADIALAINELIASGKIELLRGPDGLVYRSFVNAGHSTPVLEGDEEIVYQCIKAADNRGIWTKDLKAKTNLHQTIITKVIRSLESRKIIKAVKSVKNSTRKVYMLSHLEPSIEITGGPWFNENELDTEFIEEICKICSHFIQNKSLSVDHNLRSHDYSGYPTAHQVLEFIQNSGVTCADLSMEDLNVILYRLELDQIVEKVPVANPVSRIVDDDDDDSTYVYRSLRSSAIKSSISEFPCGACPVQTRCSESGPVSPHSCSYFKDWLS